MNNGRWKPEEEDFIRKYAGKMTLQQLADKVGRSRLAVQLYMHRKHIVVGQTVRRNLVQEMLRIKFKHPENFMPTRTFYKTVGINQMRWWDIFYGRKALLNKNTSRCANTSVSPCRKHLKRVNSAYSKNND